MQEKFVVKISNGVDTSRHQNKDYLLIIQGMLPLTGIAHNSLEDAQVEIENHTAAHEVVYQIERYFVK